MVLREMREEGITLSAVRAEVTKKTKDKNSSWHA